MRTLTTTCLLFLLLLSPISAHADVPPIKPQEKVFPDELPASPKTPWTEDFIAARPESHPWWAQVLLWVPNRVLDLIDVFKIDVGVGPTVGAVVRVTEYGQFGYRQTIPFSLRGGLFGRRMPFLIETSNEIGIGPAFIRSKDRTVCPGEVGVGVDIFLGAYAGICVDELADFAAGIFFLDIKDDDL